MGQKPLTDYSYTYIDTESRYIDSTGLDLITQNSLPKGLGFTDRTGKRLDGRIFWTRIINESDNPIDIKMSFPADSFTIVSSADSYVKVFLPPDTMTSDKESLYSYGVMGLDANLTKPTMLHRTIQAKGACLFYTGLVFTQGYGAARAELTLKGQDLCFRISGLAPGLDSILIPSGRIVELLVAK